MAEQKLAVGAEGIDAGDDDAVMAFFRLAEVEDGFDVGEIDGVQITAQLENGAADEAATEGEMQSGELGQGDLETEAVGVMSCG